MSVSISLSFIHLSFHGMYGPSTFPKELGNSRGTLSVQNREERGRGLVKKKKTSQKTWQEHCKPPPNPGTSKNHVLKGSKEIPCRHHSGFAPHQPRQHLNICCAHGHKAKLPVQACPSSSLLVCVELKRKKKSVWNHTEFLGKFQLSHPIVFWHQLPSSLREHVEGL